MSRTGWYELEVHAEDGRAFLVIAEITPPGLPPGRIRHAIHEAATQGVEDFGASNLRNSLVEVRKLTQVPRVLNETFSSWVDLPEVRVWKVLIA